LVHRFLERVDTWLKQIHFKTESVVILQNHRTSLNILKKGFTTRPKLSYNKLVLKSIRLKWAYSLRTYLISFNNVKFHVFKTISFPSSLIPISALIVVKIMFWLCSNKYRYRVTSMAYEGMNPKNYISFRDNMFKLQKWILLFLTDIHNHITS
jgi:hypothetical protein